MNAPEPSKSDVPDRPFPGAHSQVPGALSASPHASTFDTAAPRSLPLDALRERSAQGWVVRLPVRAEHPTVSKEVVISERVVLQRAMVGDVARFEVVVRREQLRLETQGQVEIAGSVDEKDRVDEDARQHPEHLAARQGLPWRSDTKRPTAG